MIWLIHHSNKKIVPKRDNLAVVEIIVKGRSVDFTTSLPFYLAMLKAKVDLEMHIKK